MMMAVVEVMLIIIMTAVVDDGNDVNITSFSLFEILKIFGRFCR